MFTKRLRLTLLLLIAFAAIAATLFAFIKENDFYEYLGTGLFICLGWLFYEFQIRKAK